MPDGSIAVRSFGFPGLYSDEAAFSGKETTAEVPPVNSVADWYVARSAGLRVSEELVLVKSSVLAIVGWV